jgi:tetratricopeptide (TPR) repeat protein
MRGFVVGVWIAVSGAGLGPILERPDAEVEAGIAALRSGDAEAALSHFDRAARARPDRGEVHWNRGLALRALGRTEEAKEAFARALATGGATREALHGLGHLHAEAGELDRAIASFRAALERDPDDAVARRNLEALLRQQAERNAPQPQGPSSEESEEDSSGEEESETNAEDESRSEGEQGSERDAPEEGAEGERSEEEGDRGEEEAGEGMTPPEGQEGSEQGDTAGGAQAADGTEEKGEPAEAGIGRQEAGSPSETERILDALEAREKSLQLFRMQDRKRSRRDVDKDW